MMNGSQAAPGVPAPQPLTSEALVQIMQSMETMQQALHKSLEDNNAARAEAEDDRPSFLKETDTQTMTRHKSDTLRVAQICEVAAASPHGYPGLLKALTAEATTVLQKMEDFIRLVYPTDMETEHKASMVEIHQLMAKLREHLELSVSRDPVVMTRFIQGEKVKAHSKETMRTLDILEKEEAAKRAYGDEE
eukprot:TRINITY_DN9783_c0_g1_i1.p1 TRINITY_DN9783_c0_g1~~TRINITY_DN9783_c0_g1_i1.p1  ORF type:complete len:191 (-),score=46.84 TRINITY_DN9783_c0_g1_i1:91-663(-)